MPGHAPGAAIPLKLGNHKKQKNCMMDVQTFLFVNIREIEVID